MRNYRLVLFTILPLLFSVASFASDGSKLTTQAVMTLHNAIDPLTGKFNYIDFSNGDRITGLSSTGTWTATGDTIHPETAGAYVAVGTTTRHGDAALTVKGSVAMYRNGAYHNAVSEVGGTSTGQTMTNPIMLGTIAMSGAALLKLAPIEGSVWNSSGSFTVSTAVNEDIVLDTSGSGTVRHDDRYTQSGFFWVGTQTYSYTGSTDETTFVDVSIPAGTLGDYGYCEVLLFGTVTNSANAKTPKIYLDGKLLKQVNITTNSYYGMQATFYNMGASSQQWGNTSGFSSFTNSGAYATNSTDSSANPLVISIRMKLADVGDIAEVHKILINAYYRRGY